MSEMSDYAETLQWLYGLTARGIKFGLENVRELLRRVGNPQEAFRSVHVGGTNGKGSVCAMISAVLQAEGHRTGLYTSPHLVEFTERVRVDGRAISEEEVVNIAGRLRPHVEAMDARGMRLTFFELTTAMAFIHFMEEGVEVAVIEVGLGGRLDATNVILPICTVITRLGIEHTEYLGNTLASIASEKAGIVKEGVPVLTSETKGEALDEISRICTQLSAPLTVVKGAEALGRSLEGIKVCLGGKAYDIPLIGRYQASNASLAYEALMCISSMGVEVTEDGMAIGLKGVKWPARLDLVARFPNVIVDVTHTSEGAKEVCRELRELFPGRRIVVLGILDDKDVEGICAEFGRIASTAIVTRPDTERAADLPRLVKALRKHCDEVLVSDSVPEGMRTALSMAGKDDTVVVSGSLFTAGEAMRWLGIR
jgi:dihydrofolate synthase/folylpolyglutamate synthase